MFLARNNLPLSLLFRERSLYKYNAIPSEAVSTIDFWYEQPLYGKIDREGDAVYLLTTDGAGIAPLQGTNEFAANFVAKAFGALRTAYLRLIESKKIIAAPGYERLIVATGYTNFDRIYDEHVSGFRSFFLKEYVSKNRDKIFCFSDFIKIFFKMMEKMGKQFPITRSGFLMSALAPSSISGLTVGLSNKDASQDDWKRTYLEDKCRYIHFSNFAGAYGFFVDKNNPSRLVANIASLNMRRYLREFQLTDTAGDVSTTFRDPFSVGDVFERYYMKAYKRDYTDFFSFLIGAYSEFVENFPYAIKKKYTGTKTITRRVRRESMRGESATGAILTSKYGDRFWLKVLLKARLMETNLTRKIGKEELERVLDEALRAATAGSLDAALRYINNFVKSNNSSLVNYPGLHINSGDITKVKSFMDREREFTQLEEPLPLAYGKYILMKEEILGSSPPPMRRQYAPPPTRTSRPSAPASRENRPLTLGSMYGRINGGGNSGY